MLGRNFLCWYWPNASKNYYLLPFRLSFENCMHIVSLSIAGTFLHPVKVWMLCTHCQCCAKTWNTIHNTQQSVEFLPRERELGRKFGSSIVISGLLILQRFRSFNLLEWIYLILRAFKHETVWESETLFTQSKFHTCFFFLYICWLYVADEKLNTCPIARRLEAAKPDQHICFGGVVHFTLRHEQGIWTVLISV